MPDLLVVTVVIIITVFIQPVGAGFICIECTFASDFGAATTSFGNPRLSNRSYYAGMSELAETIQAYGAKAFIQISPGFGRQGLLFQSRT